MRSDYVRALFAPFARTPTSSPLDRLGYSCRKLSCSHRLSRPAGLFILTPLWPCAHGYADAGSVVNGLSRAEARQPRGLENHSAGVAWCRRLRELCSHPTTMQ